MAVRTLYFDESGFTGYNLLDPAQPIFAIASAEISEGHAEEILQASFPRYRGTEFKFSNIWSSKNRTGLLRFAGQLEGLADLAFIYVAHKRFAVLTKIVDFLIEPYITDAGFDFYADGFCWKYANYIHFGMTQFAEPTLLGALLSHYQSFSRNPTTENLDALQARLRMMASSTKEPVSAQSCLIDTTILQSFTVQTSCRRQRWWLSCLTGASATPKISRSFTMHHPTFCEAARCGAKLLARMCRASSIAEAMGAMLNIRCV
jgi:hypothetical protein